MSLGLLSYDRFAGDQVAYLAYLSTFRDVCVEGFRAVGAGEVADDLRGVDTRSDSAGGSVRRVGIEFARVLRLAEYDATDGCAGGVRSAGSAAGGRSCADGTGGRVDGGTACASCGNVGAGDAATGADALHRATDRARQYVSSVGDETLGKSKAKREKRKRAKLRRRESAEADVSSSQVGESDFVPEWRRQSPRAPYHRSAFADCSDDVRRELRESRAKMLVEKNRVAVVEAECNRRRLQAKLNCQVIEREVETARLKAEAESKRLIDEKMAKMPAGFAETVVSAGLESVFTVPQSLNTSSISPNSSVSVDFVVKMERTVESLAGKVNDLQAKLDAAVAAKPVPAQSAEEKRLAVKATIDRLMASVDEEENVDKTKKQAFVASMNARAKTTRGEVEKPVQESVSWLPTTKEEIAAHVAMLEREGRMNF